MDFETKFIDEGEDTPYLCLRQFLINTSITLNILLP